MVFPEITADSALQVFTDETAELNVIVIVAEEQLVESTAPDTSIVI
jgi:hypothetical protein